MLFFFAKKTISEVVVMWSANWDDIRSEWETTKITLAALAEKHDIKLGTLKSRKSCEGWSRDPIKKDATKSEKVATIHQKDATPKKQDRRIRLDFYHKQCGKVTTNSNILVHVYFVLFVLFSSHTFSARKFPLGSANSTCQCTNYWGSLKRRYRVF